MKKSKPTVIHGSVLLVGLMLLVPCTVYGQDSGGRPSQGVVAGPGEFEPGSGPAPDWRRGPHGPPGFRGGPHPGRRMRHAFAELDLTEGQRDEIKAIFEGGREQMQASHEQMRSLGQELEELIEASPFDEGAIRAKASELANVRIEMAVVRARHSGEVRAVLTPEQLELLEERKKRRKEFRGERRERVERFREYRQRR